MQPELNHNHATTSMKVLLLVFAVLLVGALGYMVYQQNTAPDETDYSTKVVKKTESVKTLTCPTIKDTEKNYISTTQGFCFNYPKDWVLTDETDPDNGIAWRVSLTDKVLPDTDYPGQIHFYKYSSLTKLDVEGTGTETLKAYLDNRSAVEDSSYQAFSEAIVAGQSGYKAQAGINSFGGGIYYFLELPDTSILKIWVAYDNNETAAILSSLTVDKL